MDKRQNIIEKTAYVSEKSRIVSSILKEYSRIKDYAEITESEIGAYSSISQFSLINQTVIGKFCSVAHGVYVGLWEHNMNVTTHSFYLYETSGDFVKGYKSYDKDSVIAKIENDVWIGANSVVLKGVTIHNGAIIGAGAVVTKDVPAYSIAVGNPATVIKYRFSEEDITFLLKTEWWDLPRDTIQDMVNKGVFCSLDKLKNYFDADFKKGR